jgi:hypothetical protein
MKTTLFWGAVVATEVAYEGKKPEKASLVAPESIGSKPHALQYAKEHDGKLTRVLKMA